MTYPEPNAPLIPDSRPEHRAILDGRRRELTALLANILTGGRRELVWEVGCGHGHFLTAYAQANPATPCVGIDIASDRIERGVRKRDRAQLHHLHFLQAEARLFLEQLPADVRFRHVFVLFPDPWPKLRHRKHRVMQPEFLGWVARRMMPEARLHFRTDDPDYFSETRQILADHPAWELCDESWSFEFETVFQARAPSYQSLLARARLPISH